MKINDSVLKVYEFDSSVQPGATADYFEVHDDEHLEAIFVSESLDETMRFCYNSGKDFEVFTLEAYRRKYDD